MKTLVEKMALFTMLLWAARCPAVAVVKVKSFPCARPDQVRRGSGAVLRQGDRSWVLTSDHVVFHGDKEEGICHQVSPETGPPLPARLLAAHFGRGLALLALPAGSSLPEALPLESLRDETLSRGEEPLTLAGYPYQSDTVLCDRKARLLSAHGHRALLPLVPEVLEVEGHAEYGMSGGGLFDQQGAFRGLISHLYFPPARERELPLGEYREETGKEAGPRVALVIPAAAILPWIETAVEGNKESDLRLLLADQLRGIAAVALGGIRFTEAISDSATGEGLVAKGDGVGVGGEGGETGESAARQLVLTVETGPTLSWPLSSYPWRAKLHDELLKQATVRITGLKLEKRRVPLGDLASTFARLEMGYRPIWKRHWKLGNLQATEKDLVDRARAAQVLCRRLTASTIRGSDAQRLLGELGSILSDLLNAQFGETRPADLAAVIFPPTQSWEKRGWNALYNLDFESAVELKRLLFQIQGDLEKVSL